MIIGWCKGPKGALRRELIVLGGGMLWIRTSQRRQTQRGHVKA